MSMRHPWWPHLDIDPIFNPFIPVTARKPSDDHLDLSNDEIETEGEGTPERIPEPSGVVEK